jgi:hypothetical protein
MQDLLEETAIAKVLATEPDAFSWDGEPEP